MKSFYVLGFRWLRLVRRWSLAAKTQPNSSHPLHLGGGMRLPGTYLSSTIGHISMLML